MDFQKKSLENRNLTKLSCLKKLICSNSMKCLKFGLHGSQSGSFPIHFQHQDSRIKELPGVAAHITVTVKT
jgi:hypothetical protein